MAFDTPTRNRLQRFVNDARRGLEEEFTRQLQNDYGLDPNSGAVTPLDNLRHLNDAQRETARILRDTLAHYRASENADEKTGLDRIVREQAFTVLNRLAALRMAEARGLMIESVGNGYQAKGFQLYARLAGTGLGETGDAYRVYLFSVFDELAQDLPGLFDRYSPQGRLFPREAALLQVLALINDAEIERLWAEDETIGWIYQYFNSKEERKAMRDASQAPRNSRELAVRNQFFTPRYVVEFLVDNTLGRLWFNATGGHTGLRDRCQYLLVKPDEAPKAATKLRDPRTLKLLDPACGSMHFGLYAFDLFVEIYHEAWAWEQQQGPGALDVSTQPKAGLGPLCQTYADEAAFQRDVPRLIVEHNIYGVDIDPRAAQIASLALWLRAQRAWHDGGVRAKDRPRVGEGHVIAAVAPPAERDLRQQFAAGLDKRDAELFEKALQMLKGLPELGVLLQVERELPHLVRQAYGGKVTGLFAEQEQEDWRNAEKRLCNALREFSQAAQATYQDRLFTRDALQGLRLIDLCHEVFDVIVMNPPFGEPAESVRAYQRQTYPSSHQDIFQCFVDRALATLGTNGFLGVLSARTGFFMGDSESWRTDVVMQNQLQLFADLGLGVLDDALVEAAAYVIKKGHSADNKIVSSRHLSTRDKETSLRTSVCEFNRLGSAANGIFIVPQNVIEAIPGAVFSYWAPIVFLERFRVEISFEKNVSSVRVGLQSGDDPRFYRLSWEIPSSQIGQAQTWRRLSKGGEYSPPFDDIHLLVNWNSNGAEMRHCSSARVQNESFYLRPGATHSVRTASAFAAKILPAGCVFSSMAQSWFIDDDEALLKSVMYFLCRVPQAYVELSVGGGDVSTSGSAARRYTTRVVHSVPATALRNLNYEGFQEDAENIFRLVAYDLERDETSCLFSGHSPNTWTSLREFSANTDIERQRLVTQALRSSWRLDQTVTSAWQLTAAEVDFVRSEVGPHPCEYSATPSVEELQELLGLPIDKLIERAVQKDGPSRWTTKKSYFVDRKTELICHISKCPPETLEIAVRGLKGNPEQLSVSLISYAVGVAFGRWVGRDVDKTPVEKFVRRPLDELPQTQPAALHAEGGRSILVMDSGHRHSLATEVENSLREIWPRSAGMVEDEMVDALGCDLVRFLDKEFFASHISEYSKSRRTAPIYWPLCSSGGNYSVWIYYHKLTSQTLFTVVNDFVEPKLRNVEDRFSVLSSKGSRRTREEEKEFEAQQAFGLELISFRDTLLSIAPTYKPNLSDGVQISAAPLWSLFSHKPWQKALRETWIKLERGDFDWAHLAMNYWPDRVREKCKADRSVAIAHGLENLYLEPAANAKKRRGRKKAGDVE